MILSFSKEARVLEDICNFLPQKKSSGNIDFYHFVYEASFKKLPQPFFYTKHRAILVFKGEGELIIDDSKWRLLPGTLFFVPPRTTFRLEGTQNFTYLYISFNGEPVKELLERFGVTRTNFIFDGLSNLCDFWMASIRRINPTNANALTESVLLYSLSFVPTSNQPQEDEGRFDSILKYIAENFNDPTLSIKKIADIYFYSEKYLSSLFKKNMNKKFTEHLNELRIAHAVAIMGANTRSVSEISAKCGFSDPLYFSKVFKKSVGVSPSEYIKARLM